jgi:hypothetical protein
VCYDIEDIESSNQKIPLKEKITPEKIKEVLESQKGDII